MRKKSLIFATFILIIDQIVKITVDNIWRFSEIIPVISNFLYFTKVYNDGAAWSMFDGSVIILIVIAILALIFLLNYQRNFQNKYRNIVAFGLVYGGLLGNLVDRIIYGYVIDYIKILIGNYNFPVFNIADMAIVGGFILLIYAVIKGEDKNEFSSKRRNKFTD